MTSHITFNPGISLSTTDSILLSVLNSPQVSTTVSNWHETTGSTDVAHLFEDTLPDHVEVHGSLCNILHFTEVVEFDSLMREELFVDIWLLELSTDSSPM